MSTPKSRGLAISPSSLLRSHFTSAVTIIAIGTLCSASMAPALTFEGNLLAMCAASIGLAWSVGRSRILTLAGIAWLASSYVNLANGLGVSITNPVLAGTVIGLVTCGLAASIGIWLFYNSRPRTTVRATRP